MILSGGRLWQDLRADGLRTIPPQADAAYAPSTTRQWLEAGYFTFSSATKKAIVLDVGIHETAEAFLGDAELYLEHAMEHQREALAACDNDQWSSPAWLFVATYYWSFFGLLTVSRLLGVTTWFLDREIARTITHLGGSTVGAGTYEVVLQAPTSAMRRPLALSKSSGRSHEALWRQFAKYLASRRTLLSGADVESRLFNAFDGAFRAFGETWPSDLRNVVNYRAGYAYLDVRKQDILKTRSALRTGLKRDLTSVVADFESALAASRGEKIHDVPQHGVTMLTCAAVLLHCIATDLLEEVLSRSKFDRRRALNRERYRESRDVALEPPWLGA